MNWFKQHEQAAVGSALPLADALANLRYNGDELIPCIAQQYDSGEVLMMAWMNPEALCETLQTGRVCYWSRSRQALWRKGESSGQVQLLKELRVDCDGDTLLLLVDQTGPACHTGRRNCFFFTVTPPADETDTITIKGEIMIDPETLYRK